MEIRKLNLLDKKELFNLIENIESSLVDDSFWIPIDDISKNHFFDNDWTWFYGAFYEEKLVGAIGLFFNPIAYEENLEQLKIFSNKTVELGRLMVNSDYRGKSIGKKMIKYVLDNFQDYELIIATVHPENIASKKTLIDSGLSYAITYTKKSGHLRDVLIKVNK